METQSSLIRSKEEAKRNRELRRAEIEATIAANEYARDSNNFALRQRKIATERAFTLKKKVAEARKRTEEAADLQKTLRSAVKDLSRVRFNHTTTLRDADKLRELTQNINDVHETIHDMLSDDPEENVQEETVQPAASILAKPLPSVPRHP